MAKQSVRKLFEHALQAKQLQKPKAQSYEVPEALLELMPKESIEIIKHFGIDAPNLLNRYCCGLEDAVIEQATAHKDYREKCLILADEVVRLRELVPEELRHPNNLQSDD